MQATAYCRSGDRAHPEQPIKELTILDTIPLTNDKKLDKINVLPVAPVFTEAIARIYEKLRFRRCSIKINRRKSCCIAQQLFFVYISCTDQLGDTNCRRRVRPFRAQPFQHRLSGGT